MKGSSSDEVWSRSLGAESLLSGWFGSSLLLMANALIFFHMAKVKSLELDPAWAGLLSCVFIMGSVALVFGSTTVYAFRAWAAIDHIPEEDRSFERTAMRLSLAFAACMSVSFTLVGVVIGRGTVSQIPAIIQGTKKHGCLADV